MAGDLFRVTHSKLETFRRCRKEFWFGYVSGMQWPEQPDTPAGIAGTGVHRAMQRLCETGDPADGWHELDVYLRMPKHAMAGPGTEWHELARQWYEQGIAAHASIESEDRWAEVTYEAASWARGVQVRGTADRVDRLGPDRYQIIDWKTGAYEEAERTDRQLDLLHIVVRAARRLPKDATVRAVAWNLRTGVQRVRELTRDDAVATFDYLGRFTARIRQEQEFAATPGAHCRFCRWQAVCSDAARLEAGMLDYLEADEWPEDDPQVEEAEAREE